MCNRIKILTIYIVAIFIDDKIHSPCEETKFNLKSNKKEFQQRFTRTEDTIPDIVRN